MKISKEKCAVCDGIVYEEAHYEAIEGSTRVLVGSHECIIALAKCQLAGGNLKVCTEIPD